MSSSVVRLNITRSPLIKRPRFRGKRTGDRIGRVRFCYYKTPRSTSIGRAFIAHNVITKISYLLCPAPAAFYPNSRTFCVNVSYFSYVRFVVVALYCPAVLPASFPYRNLPFYFALFTSQLQKWNLITSRNNTKHYVRFVR